MSAAQKITRKELLKTPDEFLTFSEKAIRYLVEHKQQFTNGLLAVCLVAALLIGLRWYMGAKAVKALTAYNAAVAEIPPQGEPDAAKSKAAALALEKVVADYPASGPGRLASIDLGNLYYSLKEYDKSIAAYQRFLGDVPSEAVHLKPLVLDSLAQVYAAKGDLHKAVETWESLLSQEGSLLKAETYLNLGRTYTRLKAPDKARKAYQDMIEKFPDSAKAALAKAALAQLGK